MNKNLGKLVAVYAISPAYQQRAIFIAVLSFVFFLAMMIGYYVRDYLGYFLLASAFLVIYLVMMFSWFWQRKNAVEVFEHGFRYKNVEAGWDQIETVSVDGTIELTGWNKQIAIPRSIDRFDDLIRTLQSCQIQKPPTSSKV